MNIPLPIGAHFSVAGGLENALYTAKKLDCPVVQIFTKNARTWKESMPGAEQIRTFKEARKKNQVHSALSHCSYLINIANPDPSKRQQAGDALAKEMERSALLGLDHVVLHPGAHLGQGEEPGIELAVDSLKQVLGQVKEAGPRLLLETTAGQGSSLGKTFEELRDILEGVDMEERLGICLDTSHIFASGYDIRTLEGYENVMEAFHRTIGLNRLFALHLNDSIPDLGSTKDRHAHIGEGCIGETAFKCIMQDPRLFHIPKILETPKTQGDREMDPVNLDRLRSFTV